MSNFSELVKHMVEEVEDFHMRFGIGADKGFLGNPELKKLIQARLNIMVEEVGEVAKDINRDLSGAAIDELADTLFVAIGTMELLSGDGLIAMESVIDKNRKKTVHTHRLDPDTQKVVRFYPVTGETTP